MSRRGFVTVATGDYYCWLAQNLAISYRLFTDRTYPLYAITDKKGAKKLKRCFDGVIVMDSPSYTFMDKLAVYENSPFDETVFIDADMDIVNDISFLFDDFADNGAGFSCIGSRIAITETTRPIHFGDEAVNQLGLTYYIAFNGGVYYYRRCPETDRFMRYIYDELVPHYHDYGMKVFRTGQMADEPLFGLAMVLLDMKPMKVTRDVMKLIQDMKTLSWDMRSRRCSFVWYGRQVSPRMLHYGTHNTLHKKYVYYNSIIRCRYRKLPVLTPFYLAYREARLLVQHLKRPQDREAFKSWFLAHFSKKYISRQMSKIKSLLKRS